MFHLRPRNETTKHITIDNLSDLIDFELAAELKLSLKEKNVRNLRDGNTIIQRHNASTVRIYFVRRRSNVFIRGKSVALWSVPISTQTATVLQLILDMSQREYDCYLVAKYTMDNEITCIQNKTTEKSRD